MSAGGDADHYAVLGVSPDTGDAGIRRAFRRLSRRHHPDLGGDAETYRAVTIAYAVLSDPGRRARYDLSRPDLAPGRRAAAAGSGGAGSGAAGPTASGTAPRTSTAPRTGAAGPPSGAAHRRTGQAPTASGTASRPGTGRAQAPAPRGPAHVLDANGERVPAASGGADTLVTGRLARRGLIDRSRDERSTLITDLFEQLVRRLPAARMVLGAQVPGAGRVDALIAVDRRVALVELLPTADVPHTWDGRILRAAGRPLRLPAPGSAALERAVGGSRAEAFTVMFTSAQRPHSPVVERVGPPAAAGAPLNPARALGEIAAFLAGAVDPDAVRLPVLAALREMSTTRR